MIKWEDVCRLGQFEYLVFKRGFVCVDDKFMSALRFLINKFDGASRLARALYLKYKGEPVCRYKWRIVRLYYSRQVTVPEQFYKNVIEFARENGWS